jgi:DNA-binding IclR family transcriptional regulator
VPSGPQRIQSVERALALLRAVATMAPGEASVGALAERCGLTRSTAWRLLTTLQSQHFIERVADSNSYRIGFATYYLGAMGAESLVASAHPILGELAAAAGDTASLAVPQGLALVYVDQVGSPDILSADWLGRRAALHATSTGKAYLAWLPPEEVTAVLPAGLERYTSTTLVDERAFRNELARTRERGYSTCEGELETMLWGVSAPVFDAARRPVAVVSVWGPSRRVRRERFGALGALVIDAAAATARELEIASPSHIVR